MKNSTLLAHTTVVTGGWNFYIMILFYLQATAST